MITVLGQDVYWITPNQVPYSEHLIFFIKRPYKLEYTTPEGLTKDKTPYVSYEENERLQVWYQGLIHNTTFYS